MRGQRRNCRDDHSFGSTMATVPPVLEDVARTLGYSPAQAFMRVTMRLASPGIAAGALLVLLTVMKELPATLMLRPTGENTLATRLWSLSEVGAYAAAAPYSLSLIAIGAIPAFVLAVPLVRASKHRGAASTGSQSRDLKVEMEASSG